ncbi:TetR/AcrR family transcriptional regulator [Roseicyclus persicicus]|uniref:TetR/AcrR family transcriptional regulator n=1 Tax=Roseicyclus persicicus TaxID=2650661 RepID=A0A7X6H1Q9_9RHOB|nr:TetR/AcrR family transcriptional regulator [Roseibacterium persicicum]NKX46431.1 TetR/AcrR family transcriptional regulator [Roseibacterium persicicum]
MATLNKADLLAAMAGHVRANGLAGASLRPLARAAATSDRMLIYHFGSKDRLIAALLDRLIDEMLGAFAAALPPQRAESEADIAAAVIDLLRTPTFRPYLRVWFDILSAAGRDDATHGAAAHRLLQGQVRILMTRLPEGLRQPRTRAREMLALVQGMLVLDAVGMGKAADLARARFYPR